MRYFVSGKSQLLSCSIQRLAAAGSRDVTFGASENGCTEADFRCVSLYAVGLACCRHDYRYVILVVNSHVVMILIRLRLC